MVWIIRIFASVHARHNTKNATYLHTSTPFINTAFGVILALHINISPSHSIKTLHQVYPPPHIKYIHIQSLMFPKYTIAHWTPTSTHHSRGTYSGGILLHVLYLNRPTHNIPVSVCLSYWFVLVL
eukprot:247008_1